MSNNMIFFNFNFYSKKVFKERRREGEREGEKHWCERETSTGCRSYGQDQTHNQGRCSDWEPNQQPFTSWEDANQVRHIGQG